MSWTFFLPSVAAPHPAKVMVCRPGVVPPVIRILAVLGYVLNPQARNAWKEACKISRPVSDTMNICAKHFKDNDLWSSKDCKIRVRKGAVPSINVPCEYVPKKRGPRCVVPGCSNVQGGRVTFHRIPRNENRRKEWLVVCRLIKSYKDTRICSDHFTDEDFITSGRSKKLKSHSVIPSCNLPRGRMMCKEEFGYFCDRRIKDESTCNLLREHIIFKEELEYFCDRRIKDESTYNECDSLDGSDSDGCVPANNLVTHIKEETTDSDRLENKEDDILPDPCMVVVKEELPDHDDEMERFPPDPLLLNVKVKEETYEQSEMENVGRPFSTRSCDNGRNLKKEGTSSGEQIVLDARLCKESPHPCMKMHLHSVVSKNAAFAS